MFFINSEIFKIFFYKTVLSRIVDDLEEYSQSHLFKFIIKQCTVG